MKRQLLIVIQLMSIILLISSCTKSRKAELNEEQLSNVFAISEFGTISDNSEFSAEITSELKDSNAATPLSLETDSYAHLRSFETKVPENMKFMFENMPLMNLKSRHFQIAFSVDREFVSAYKIVKDKLKTCNLTLKKM